jgi:hypothetical protein
MNSDVLREAAARLKAATAAASAEVARMRDGIKAKRDELAAVMRAPLPQADVERRAREEVRIAGERFMDEIGVHVARRVAGPDPAHGNRRSVPWTALEPPAWGFACVTDPQAAVAALLRVYELGLTAEAGLPASERPAARQRLEAEIAALEAAEEQAVDAAAAAGLTVEHRPEVLRRRKVEEDQRQREAAQREAAERRQRDLDEREAAERKAAERKALPSKGGPSAYLAAAAPDLWR